MDIFDEPINADQYQINKCSFELVNKDTSPYEEIAARLEYTFSDQGSTKFWLQGSDEKRKNRIAYTVGLDKSESSEWTVPVFEISLPSPNGFEETRQYSSNRNDEMSAYRNYLRSLFIEEDSHGRLISLGPIGKCLSLSQERNVVLFLKGIDRVPGKLQSTFFGILERRPKIQCGIEIKGDPENLTVFSTTGETSNPKDLDQKLRSILGTAHRIEPDRDGP